MFTTLVIGAVNIGNLCQNMFLLSFFLASLVFASKVRAFPSLAPYMSLLF